MTLCVVSPTDKSVIELLHNYHEFMNARLSLSVYSGTLNINNRPSAADPVVVKTATALRALQ